MILRPFIFVWFLASPSPLTSHECWCNSCCRAQVCVDDSQRKSLTATTAAHPRRGCCSHGQRSKPPSMLIWGTFANQYIGDYHNPLGDVLMVLRLLKSTNVGWAWGKSSGFTTKNCNGTPPTTTPLVDLIWLFHVSSLDLRYLNLIGGAPTLPCSRVSGLLVEARQSLQAFILFYHVNASSIFQHAISFVNHATSRSG